VFESFEGKRSSPWKVVLRMRKEDQEEGGNGV